MFDYIVIGAGSAGCVVANRLSENPANTVLLLEAGPKDNNPMIHMPGGCGEVLKSKTLNWHFYSTPQKNLDGRKYFVPRGKMLGGSSGANGMVYIRGNAADYDDWATAGNTGWSYAEVLPHFRRLEDQIRGADDFHGTGGPLFVNNAPSDNPLFDMFISAGEEAGIKRNDDFNGADQEGVGRFQCTIKDGKRWSSAAAFLTPVRKRPNLTITTGALVKRLVMEGTKVVGVDYMQGKKVVNARVNKEVVVCAGAIQSPQILQLSGIGNKTELEKLGIKVNVNLPGVGENLQEHLDWTVNVACKEPITLNGSLSIHKQIAVGLNYFLFKKGIGACNNIEGGGFIKTSPELERPDVQLHFVPVNMTGLIDDMPKEHGITLHACCLRPKSKGHVKITSTDPAAHPEIDFNFLEHQEDWDTLLKAFKILREITGAKAWNGILGEEIAPGPQVQTDEQIRACFPSNSDTVYHPVGTCKMGNDDTAVVDHELKVRGVQGLRVADASIIPEMIGGNTNAPAMMIGDKCASMILGEKVAPAKLKGQTKEAQPA
jgi:choline dehydrogenase